MGLTPAPSDSTPVEREFLIMDWHAREDGISVEELPLYFSDATLAECSVEPSGHTRLGGVPCWIQSAEEAPKGWRYVGQLSCSHTFLRAPLVMTDDVSEYEGEYHCDGPNFGDGIAYLYVRATGAGLQGWFFWQC